jgi:hypothetical protein
VHLDAILAVKKRLLGQCVDLVHDGIGHGEAADLRAATVEENVGTRAAERAVECVGKTDVYGPGVAATDPQLRSIEGVKALGRLAVAFVLLGTQSSGPVADRVGGEELEAIISAHPELKLRLPFEDPHHDRISGREALLLRPHQEGIGAMGVLGGR